jgi:tetratricopeptide (TPR) repeat protein
MRCRILFFVVLAGLFPLRAGAQIRPLPAGPQPATVTLAIFPFENAGSRPAMDWLGEGLAELCMDRIAGEGRVVVSRAELLAAAERVGLPAAPGNSSRLTRATLVKLAEQTDADFVIYGRFSADDRTLSVTAHVLRMSPMVQSAPLTESGPLEDLSLLQARLCWQLLRFIDPAYPFSRAEFTQRFSRLRLDAFENYIRGILTPDDAARLRHWREAARLEPAWSDPAFALGQFYFAAKDYDSAASWFRRIDLHAEHGPEAAFFAGTAYLLRNEPARAESQLASLAESSARSIGASPETLNNLALARSRLSKGDEAVALLQRAVQRAPADADYWFNLGLTCLLNGDSSGAIRPLREAARRAEDDLMARALLVYALELVGRVTEAAAERERAGPNLPGVAPDGLVHLQRIKRTFELPESARANDRAISPRRAQSLRRHLAQGADALASARLPDAERHFSAAALLAPDLRDAHVGLAETYERQGKLDAAEREWRAALWSGDDAEVRFRLAQLYLAMKPPRTSDARNELRAALRLNASPSVRENIRRLLDDIERRARTGSQP